MTWIFHGHIGFILINEEALQFFWSVISIVNI